MTTKFELCLDYLSKEASDLTRASGLQRYGQLLSGSRVRALQGRMHGAGQASQRALRVLSSPEATHQQSSVLDRMHANVGAMARAGREARREGGAVSLARGLTAGGIGAAGLGAYAATQQEPEEGAEVAPKSPFREGAKVLGSSLAGFGLGHVAGALAGRGIEAVTKHQGGDPAEVARKIAPLVGTAAGFIYPMWRAREQQEITNAVESARDENERRVSGQ